MIFHDPWLLIFLPFGLALLLLGNRKARMPGIRFSTGEILAGLQKSWRVRLCKKTVFLRVFSLILIVLALARPQFVAEEKEIKTEGIDIVLAVDVSTSMLAEDAGTAGRKENRFQAARDVIREFVQGREGDRIGVVLFAGMAYTLCPLTHDHEWLLENLERVKVGEIEDGTALGSGLFSALKRLKREDSREKIIVLLSDGRNNAGKVAPSTASAAARALNAKVYTVGLGSQGPAPYPVKGPFGNAIYKTLKLNLDEKILSEVASIGNGRYFRAADKDALREVFKEIDRLEKSPVREKRYFAREELFHLFLIPGLVLLFLEIFLKMTFLRRVP